MTAFCTIFSPNKSLQFNNTAYYVLVFWRLFVVWDFQQLRNFAQNRVSLFRSGSSFDKTIFNLSFIKYFHIFVFKFYKKNWSCNIYISLFSPILFISWVQGILSLWVINIFLRKGNHEILSHFYLIYNQIWIKLILFFYFCLIGL